MLLFTTQPKLDTKGKCYTLALQQILTGVYIAELSLIGLFGLREATGPSVVLAVLLVATIVYHGLMNRYFAPLERFLPADIEGAGEGEGEEERENRSSEQTPLLAQAQAQAQAEEGQSPTQHLHHHVQAARQTLIHPLLSTSHRSVARWLTSHPDFSALTVPAYSEQQLRTAYLNPALESRTPVVWLPRDRMGVSGVEVRECEALGLEASDEGAWVDGRGRVGGVWMEGEGDWAEIPGWKEGVRW